MDASSIPSRSNGQTILASWFNTLRSYLIQLVIIPLNVDTDYTFTGTTNTILVDSSTGAVNITLPDVTLNSGSVFNIIVKDSTNTITILPATGSILGRASYEMKMNYESIRLITDGVDWYAI